MGRRFAMDFSQQVEAIQWKNEFALKGGNPHYDQRGKMRKIKHERTGKEERSWEKTSRKFADLHQGRLNSDS